MSSDLYHTNTCIMLVVEQFDYYCYWKCNILSEIPKESIMSILQMIAVDDGSSV